MHYATQRGRIPPLKLRPPLIIHIRNGMEINISANYKPYQVRENIIDPCCPFLAPKNLKTQNPKIPETQELLITKSQ